MPSSNQGKGRNDRPPVRSTGRTFSLMDPERVPEVVVDQQADDGAGEHRLAPAKEASRLAGALAGGGRQHKSKQGGESGG